MIIEKPYRLVVPRLVAASAVVALVALLGLDVRLPSAHSGSLLGWPGVLLLVGAGMLVAFWVRAETAPNRWVFEDDRALFEDLYGRQEVLWAAVTDIQFWPGEYRGRFEIRQQTADGRRPEVIVRLVSVRREAMAALVDVLLAKAPDTVDKDGLTRTATELLGLRLTSVSSGRHKVD